MSEHQDAREIRKMEDMYSRYDVVDRNGEKISTVDTAYIDDRDQNEYVEISRGVIGFILGMGCSLLTIDNNMYDYY